MAQARTTTRGSATGVEQPREGRIGSAAHVRGRIHGEGDLVIEGHVEGDVAIRGDLTIAEGATVQTSQVGAGGGHAVEAHAVSIAGKLAGDLAATGPVRLSPTAQVSGNLRGSAVAIDEGARFAGMLECEFELPPELGGTSGSSRGDGRPRVPARR
jgi:cytoskeletal protein CcmA (bactofilin family)